MQKSKKPELLAPVADFVMLRAAIGAGADAVYFGIKGLNMRSLGAKNFEIKDLKKITDICHKNKVKAYLTVNTIIYENELSSVKKILNSAKSAKIDAIICWDLAVIREAKKLNLPIHISTQANISNSESTEFYKKLAAERIILARECSLKQIKQIIKKTKIEVEVFVHGAMCVSVSGRCFLSQFLFGKSANRGECLQPCRRSYIAKDIEDDFELEIQNNYVLSPKDLCTLPFLDKLIKAGIKGFKIEGRARSPEYVKTVTETYRKAIDLYFEKKFNKKTKEKLLEKLKTVYNRGFGSGFYLGKPIEQWAGIYGSKATTKKIYLGKVKNFYKKLSVAEIKLEAGSIKKGDKIMFQGNKTGVFTQDVGDIEINHKKVLRAEKGKNIALKTEKIVRENDLVFLIKKK